MLAWSFWLNRRRATRRDGCLRTIPIYPGLSTEQSILGGLAAAQAHPVFFAVTCDASDANCPAVGQPYELRLNPQGSPLSVVPHPLLIVWHSKSLSLVIGAILTVVFVSVSVLQGEPEDAYRFRRVAIRARRSRTELSHRCPGATGDLTP
jgi:hypothetical protein